MAGDKYSGCLTISDGGQEWLQFNQAHRFIDGLFDSITGSSCLMTPKYYSHSYGNGDVQPFKKNSKFWLKTDGLENVPNPNLIPLAFLDFIFFGKLGKEFWQELEESSAYFFLMFEGH